MDTGAGVEVRLRDARPDDAAFLAAMLVEAADWRPGSTQLPATVLAWPRVDRYVEGWPRPGDLALVAEATDDRVGAAWCRLFSADRPGYGFVAADVPELSIAVVPRWRGHGVGRRLVEALLARAAAAGHPSISLSVDRGNPARRLYESLGFREVGGEGGSVTMLAATG